MVYLEQALPPYFAAPAGCSLRQRYPYHPISYQHNQGWQEQGFCNKESMHYMATIALSYAKDLISG